MPLGSSLTKQWHEDSGLTERSGDSHIVLHRRQPLGPGWEPMSGTVLGVVADMHRTARTPRPAAAWVPYTREVWG